MKLTEAVRARLYKVTGHCPACGGPGMSLRAIAKAAGIHQTAVFRFQKGLPITSTNLDKLAAWIEKRESATKPEPTP